MQINFYSTFTKRENSTKVPSESPALTLTGKLIEPCSIMNPVFQIERLAADAVPEAYIYAQITAFGRYYFVDDWIWNNGLWECHMHVDVLASWKTQIGNTTAYVERSASRSNGAVVDHFYPATTDFSITEVNLASSWNGYLISSGCYVIGVVCNANRATSQIGGAVTYYVLSPSQMGNLMSYLLSDTFLDEAGFPVIMTNTQQLAHETAKALVNPSQYIVSCMWLPVSQSMISDGIDHRIALGYYDLDYTGSSVLGQYLNAVMFTLSVTGDIPIHPQAATRGKYLNYAPYTRISLFIPPFGIIPLDTSFCEIGSYLKGTVYVDAITGKATLRIHIWPDSTHQAGEVLVTEMSTMIGVPIQIAQMTPDFLSAIGTTFGLAGNIATGYASGGISGAVMSGVMSAPSAIGNTLDSIMPQVERSGVTGSFLEVGMSPSMIAQHFVVADEDNTEFGRPLCESVVLNTLTGYIKCKDADVDYYCMAEEKKKILNYLLSGFFME